MTHYRMSYNLPSASILSRNQLSSSFDESRIYNENTVFMENKQEFSIKLFNPLSKKIGVQIGLNGEFSKHLVILRPGEDITIDRFIDNSSKMLFETYNYDASNAAASNAVVNNGIVDVNFFNEKQIEISTFTTSGSFNLSNHNFTTFDAANKNTRTYDADLYSTLSNTNGMGNISNTTSLDLNDNGSVKPTKTRYKKISKTFTPDPSKTQRKWRPITETPKKSIKETGMVSKGDTSEQAFEQVNVDFDSVAFHSLKIFIKPNSEKPYEDIEVREYCTQCSYRIRNKKWNFCPKCGSDV